jgi:pimeloyl-ACP methyl ester carboxylesterase
MPYAQVRGIEIKYDVIGSGGPWVALASGGRSPYAEIESLSRKIADHGFRVVLHDRRNCGGSQVALDASESEDEHRVSDWHALLTHLGATPTFLGGSSSGARMSMRYALRYPALVRGLLLMRVTGGPFQAQRLPENYYSQFIRAAEQGGMEAVCAMDHWKAVIAARPENGDILRKMPVKHFIDVMTKWRTALIAGGELPVAGVSAAELASIKAPTIIVPGNDKIHNNASGKVAHRHIPGSKLHELPIEDTGADIVPFPQWGPNEPEIAKAFADFMRSAT